jgi:hypothetical protein
VQPILDVMLWLTMYIKGGEIAQNPNAPLWTIGVL